MGLQKFLQKEGSRTPEDHLKAHERLTETESFPVNYEMFKKTKIGKVVKLISKMTGLESDPHEIIQRAQALMGKWRSILEGGVTPTADNNGPLSAVPGETPKLPSEHIQTVAPEDVTLPPSVPASQEEASSSAAAPSVTPMEVDVSASTAVATETVTSLVNDIVDFATSSCTSTVIPEPLTATSIETPPTITITAAHPLSSTDAEKQIPSPSTENLNSPAFMAHFNELNQTLRAEDKTLTVPEIGSDMLDSLMNNGVQNGETGAVKKDVKVEGGDDDAEESGMTLKAEEAIV